MHCFMSWLFSCHCLDECGPCPHLGLGIWGIEIVSPSVVFACVHPPMAGVWANFFG